MNNMALIVLSLLFVVACGSSGGGDSLPKAKPPLPEPQPKGQFVVTESGPNVFVEACEDFDQLAIDTRLKEGQEFLVEDVVMDQEQSLNFLSSNQRNLITEINRDENYIVRKIFYDDLGPQYWSRNRCDMDFKNNITTCQSVENSPLLEKKLQETFSQSAQNPSFFRNCFFDYDKSEEISTSAITVEKGIYTFEDGRQVTAFRTTYSAEGPVKCYQGAETVTDLGRGKQTNTLIQSSEVPALRGVTCGGPERVFSHQVLANEAGEIINLRKFELKGGTF